MDYKSLIGEKDRLEAEIEEQRLLLIGPGKPGLTGGLVDEQGFPIGDVGLIISVRNARKKLSELQNDHKTLMKQIENYLATMNSNPTKTDTPKRSSYEEYQNLKPIAMVDEVSFNSPAFRAGLKVGDALIAFGSVDRRTVASQNIFPQIAATAKNSIDKIVPLFVKRAEKIMKLFLVPGVWDGRGIVGFHIVPVS